jgi:hypothetical protein
MFDQHRDDACGLAVRLFENAEWRLLPDGLEHRATGYFIARDAIGMRRGDLWEWPLHLAEKSWCTLRSFRQAFLAAVDTFGAAPDDGLDQSFAVGFGRVAGAGTRAGADDFIALGEVVRPKSTTGLPTRKRSAGIDPRIVIRRAGAPMPQRASDGDRQRAAL